MAHTKAGRPSRYSPAFCENLIAHLASGLSYEAFAGVIGVHKDTLYAWEAKYPRFSDAKRMGVEKGRLYWERIGLMAASGGLVQMSAQVGGTSRQFDQKKFNAAVFIFTMKNRFGWRDKSRDEAIEDTAAAMAVAGSAARIAVDQAVEQVRAIADDVARFHKG